MELVAKKTIAALRANLTDSVNFAFGHGFGGDWTIHVVPIDSGVPHGGGVTDPVVTVLYSVAGVFRATNPATTFTAATNKDTQSNKDDQVGSIQLQFANGNNPPDGGAVIEIWASRITN